MTRCAILRTRLPFLCNMATTTCKPAAEPVLPLVRTVPENVQSRDTFYHEPEFLTWRREGSCLNGTRRSIYPGPTTKATSRSRVWSATSRLASRKGTRADSANSAASRAQESLLLSRCEVQ